MESFYEFMMKFKDNKGPAGELAREAIRLGEKYFKGRTPTEQYFVFEIISHDMPMGNLKVLYELYDQYKRKVFGPAYRAYIDEETLLTMKNSIDQLESRLIESDDEVYKNFYMNAIPIFRTLQAIMKKLGANLVDDKYKYEVGKWIE